VRPEAPGVLRSPGVGIGKEAHHDPARARQQHAIVGPDASNSALQKSSAVLELFLLAIADGVGREGGIT
jgi:hypothetical protein